MELFNCTCGNTCGNNLFLETNKYSDRGWEYDSTYFILCIKCKKVYKMEYVAEEVRWKYEEVEDENS